MATMMNDKVLSEAFGPTSGTALRVKQAALVIAGIAILAVAAKIRVPMWPVPITMGTFAVLAMLADPEQARELGRNGAEFVQQHYSWQSSAAPVLLGLYQRLLGGAVASSRRSARQRS